MVSPISVRRRPHCHKCGLMMQGHKRKNGLFVCPKGPSSIAKTVSSSVRSRSTPLPSPPVSPSVSPLPSPDFLPVHEKHVFKPPPGEHWHWRNPNWVSPPREMPLYTPGDGERGSLTPTEPVTEPSQRGTPLAPNLTQEEEEEPWFGKVEDSESGYLHFSNSPSPHTWSPFSQSSVIDINLNTVLRASTPLFNVFRTPREDLDDVKRTAQREGKHVAIINAPLAHRAMAKVPSDKVDGTVWVVVSDHVEDLKYAIDSQQGGMPGTLFPEEPPASGMGFFQVMAAGVMGGLMVTVGLAYM